MGRKKVSKPCTVCCKQCELTGFTRIEWEKSEELSTVRTCRNCDQSTKRWNEPASTVASSIDSLLPPPLDFFSIEDLPDSTLFKDEDFSFTVGDPNAPITEASLKLQAKSVQAKRRRVRMNALFNSIATELGKDPESSDRLDILETTLELLRDRNLSKNKKQHLLVMDDVPLISMLDVLAEEEIFSTCYSQVA